MMTGIDIIKALVEARDAIEGIIWIVLKIYIGGTIAAFLLLLLILELTGWLG